MCVCVCVGGEGLSRGEGLKICRIWVKCLLVNLNISECYLDQGSTTLHNWDEIYIVNYILAVEQVVITTQRCT